MSIITQLYSFFSYSLLNEIDEARKTPWDKQLKVFESLINSGKDTFFGNEHNFDSIQSVSDFQKRVPLRDYDKFEPYINRIRKGENYILWNQKVKWFAKSSGTSSSKSKFIPITDDSLNNCHFLGMRKMLATYLNQNPNSKLFKGHALTLGGSVAIDEAGSGESFYGDLSAIMLRNTNFLVELKRVPAKEIALLPDFETKVSEICKAAKKYNVTNFAGVPSWNLVLMNRILDYHNIDNLLAIWPNLELFMHGGINFEPYKEQYKKLIPSESMNYRENYNASEGYFAFQDEEGDESMLLSLFNGIFYEFIPLEKLDSAISGEFKDFETIESVKRDTNYAMVISTNSGLWRYLIGDTVVFTSLLPHKIKVTGRTQLFINAFGEELMISNAEKALAISCKTHNVNVSNYTVAPLFMKDRGKGAHQWLIEFENDPESIDDFANTLDKSLCELNSDYDAKRAKSVTMERLKLVALKSGCFYEWLKNKDKLGGQNKVPRLSNNRTIVEELLEINGNF
jgi:hypothetical protein